MSADASVAAAVAILRAVYPRQPFPDETIEVYVRMLDDLDGQLVVAAVEQLITTSEWLPSVAEIRRAAAEIACDLPSVAEAWRIASIPAAQIAGVIVHPLVKESMGACGGRWSITHSETPERTRTQFERDYEIRRAEALNRSAAKRPKELERVVGVR